MACKHVDAAGKRLCCRTYKLDTDISQSFVPPQLPSQSTEKIVHSVLTL